MCSKPSDCLEYPATHALIDRHFNVDPGIGSRKRARVRYSDLEARSEFLEIGRLERVPIRFNFRTWLAGVRDPPSHFRNITAVPLVFFMHATADSIASAH